MSKNNPLVSVIIPTKNEENYIKDTLFSIKKQNYKNIEIIIVDSSDDNTIPTAKKFTNKIIRSQVNIPKAKNLGAKHARGEILVFLDADTILLPSWIDRGLKYILNEEYDAVIGNISTREKNFRAFLIGGILKSFLELTGFINNFSMGGLHFMITKKFFEKVGGFREDFSSCEDIEVIKKIKSKGKVKIEKKMFSLISMRRFEKNGYIRWTFNWALNGLHYIFKKQPFYKYYYPIFR